MKAHIQRYFCSYLQLLEQLSVPRNRIGLNVFRVLAGCLILLEYVLNYGDRFCLMGPRGIITRELFAAERPGLSLYQFSSNSLVFDLLFHAGIIITAAWVLGFRTRLLTPLTYAFWFSLRQTNPFLWDGGDNLLQLVLIYACFADLSPLRKALQPTAPGATRSLSASISGLLHNGAVLAFALQVCFLYGVSGLSKIQGEAWQNGTALYYALWPAQFRFPGVSELLFRNAALLAVASYSTVFFQVAFPFLFCLNRRTRAVAVLLATTFHLGIAAFMGLFTFAGFMIATDLALLEDAGYLRALRALQSLGRRALGLLQRRAKVAPDLVANIS